MRRARDWWANPWGQPRVLGVVTWLYMVWSIVPVFIAILFSFNDGRSRSVWQGFSFRWYWGDPNQSVLHDPSLRGALEQSLKLAGLDMLIAVPLGVGLAIGLTRWRGFGAQAGELPDAVPARHARDRDGGVAAPRLRHALQGPARDDGAGARSGDLLDLVRRARRPEPPALDRPRVRGGGARSRRLRASARCGSCCCRCSLRRSSRASMVVFALSIDDFVVTDYLSSNSSTQTVPIKIYSSVRGTTTPALNAVATVLVAATLFAVLLAGFVYRRSMSKQSAETGIGAARDRSARHLMADHDGHIELQELRKSFTDVAAVDGIDLQIEAGEFFSLLGPSGCGKTTTLRLIAGFERPDSGRILLDGVDMAATPPHKRQGQHRLPELRALPAPRRLRQRRLRAPPPSREARRDHSRASTRFSRRYGLAVSGSGGRRSSRAASSSASRSHVRSSSTRRSCCSTSRSAPSTPSCGRRCRSS